MENKTIRQQIKTIRSEIEQEQRAFEKALQEGQSVVVTERQTDEMQALRYNQGKVEWSLVDYKSLESMVKVLEYGVEKYARNNWKKGMPATQIIESMLRHTYKLLEGELVDSESGIEHIGHIQCNAMFLSYVLSEKPEYNDLGQD
jgi:hypothetical protein